MNRDTRHSIKAFTLLEISVVLVLISIIIGGGLVVFSASIQQSQYNATLATMQAIDTALYNFRVANNRLPCPGDLTQPNTSVSYGLEAGTLTPGITAATIPSSGVGNGICGPTFATPSPVLSVNIAGTPTNEPLTPAANFGDVTDIFSTSQGIYYSEGAVPTRALKLPDSYMYDAWGDHINYAVDVSTTVTNAFITYPNQSLNPCGPFAICDVGGASGETCVNTARSSTATYVLLSHGANQVGGYTQSGTMSSTLSTNANEQTNCHYIPASSTCAINGTASDPTYVQQLPGYQTGNAGNQNYYFDDLVTFKERWQLMSPQDSNPPAAPGNGLGLILGGADGRLYPYAQSGPNFTYVSSNPVTQPTMIRINATTFSPDNSQLAVSGQVTSGLPSLIIYSVTSGMLTVKYSLLTTSPAYGLSYSPDFRNLAVGGDITTDGWTTIAYFWPQQAYAYTELYNFPPTSTISLFSPDGKYFASNDPGLVPFLMYPVGCGNISGESTAASKPTGWGGTQGFSFSNDSKYFATASTISGNGEIIMYKNSGGGVFTALATPLILPYPATTVTAVAFSHNGNTLVAIGNAAPYVFFYHNNRDDTFTAYPTVSVGAGAHPVAVAWSKDDQYVAIANGPTDTGDVPTNTTCGTGYVWCGLALYQVNGMTVNPLPAVATPPGPLNNAYMNTIAFTN